MNNLSPEELQAMMEMIMQGQMAGSEQEGIKRQLGQADAMRGPAALGMRDAGRMQVAPHWLELLGGLGKEAASTKLRGKADKRQEELGKSTALQNQRLLEILMRQAAQPPAVSPAMPQQGQPNGINLAAPQGQGLRTPPGMTPPFGM